MVTWFTGKQSSVTKTLTVAEYVALSEVVSEVLLIKDLLNSFKVKIEKPINKHEDNSGLVSIAKYGNFTKNSKYIEVHYHFINENYVEGLIDIVKVGSEKNVADKLTKALGKLRFKKLRELLNLI